MAKQRTAKVSLNADLYNQLELLLAPKGLTVDSYLAQLLQVGAEQLGLGDLVARGSMLSARACLTDLEMSLRPQKDVSHLRFFSIEQVYVDECDLPGAEAELGGYPRLSIEPKPSPSLIENQQHCLNLKRLEKVKQKAAEALHRVRHMKKYASIYGENRITVEQARAEIEEIINRGLPSYLSGYVTVDLGLEALNKLLKRYVEICKNELDALLRIQSEPMPRGFRAALSARVVEARLKDEQRLLTEAYREGCIPGVEVLGPYNVWAGDLTSEERAKLAFAPQPGLKHDSPVYRQRQRHQRLLDYALEELRAIDRYVENTEIRSEEAPLIALDLAEMPVATAMKRDVGEVPKDARTVKKKLMWPPRPKAPRLEVTAEEMQIAAHQRLCGKLYQYQYVPVHFTQALKTPVDGAEGDCDVDES